MSSQSHYQPSLDLRCQCQGINCRSTRELVRHSYLRNDLGIAKAKKNLSSLQEGSLLYLLKIAPLSKTTHHTILTPPDPTARGNGGVSPGRKRAQRAATGRTPSISFPCHTAAASASPTESGKYPGASN
eukprot:CAMPEP_0113581620 /NCGR_PEP_ID=MMETSP0015_2-20120614/31412_1 /TAXON_ID=2838 /ORGANISM="Odontella" /LENGTH=128 /DNA_ID=CAMNT_0000486105 /DNA_START=154 /DNA_END=537 /DNA_ORIENTATION=+ /assembly_acc=CAM_ASM_000160